MNGWRIEWEMRDKNERVHPYQTVAVIWFMVLGTFSAVLFPLLFAPWTWSNSFLWWRCKCDSQWPSFELSLHLSYWTLWGSVDFKVRLEENKKFQAHVLLRFSFPVVLWQSAGSSRRWDSHLSLLDSCHNTISFSFLAWIPKFFKSKSHSKPQFTKISGEWNIVASYISV